jgi:hypothetical protein
MKEIGISYPSVIRPGSKHQAMCKKIVIFISLGAGLLNVGQAFTVTAVVGSVSPTVTIYGFSPAAMPGQTIERADSNPVVLYAGSYFVQNTNYQLTLSFPWQTAMAGTPPAAGLPLKLNGQSNDQTGAVLSYIGFRRSSGTLVTFTNALGCSLVDPGTGGTEITFNQAGQTSCQVDLSGMQAVANSGDTMNTSDGIGDYKIVVSSNATAGTYSALINFTINATP